jgi:hypothetical protein
MRKIARDYCPLRLAADGKVEVCARERCRFWEPGGTALPGRCILERLATDIRRAGVATCLLEVRDRVNRARYVART